MAAHHDTWLKRYFYMKHMSCSNVALPKTRTDRFKYFIWNTYAPIHPRIRNSLLACKLVRHSGRQPFLIGYLASGITYQSFIEKIEEIGYCKHLLAWQDDDEVVSLRLSDGFTHQYHLRIFSDGEVRGHYEYTPEAYPIAHLARVHFRDEREFFLQQFHEYITPAYELVKKDKVILEYTRAFVCFFYNRKCNINK